MTMHLLPGSAAENWQQVHGHFAVRPATFSRDSTAMTLAARVGV